VGAVVGCLLIGVAVGQLGVVMPGIVGRIFFLLFLFSVGCKTGPQFFGSLGKNAVALIVLTVVFSVVGIFTTYALARMSNFDTGTATGLFSGGLQSSEAMGTGTVAIAKPAISEDLRRTFTANVTVGYAVTYLVTMFTGILILIQIGPWMPPALGSSRASSSFGCWFLQKDAESRECEPIPRLINIGDSTGIRLKSRGKPASAI
jgi:putative transport protein